MSTTKHKSGLLSISILLLMLAIPLLQSSSTRAQETTHTFPETGKTVSGIFLQYWQTHGGLAQQGYPISDEMTLKSTDGKEYKTQFFERAVFEQHPEFAGTENEVLLKLVGQTFYDRHFGATPPSGQTVNPTNTQAFKETGHSIGGKFRDYWEKHGGLAQQGYPMTDEFRTASTDGKEYTTQVFQRAAFELHPEFVGTENEVLLRLLGVEEWAELNKAEPTPAPTKTPTAYYGFEELGVPVDDGKDHRKIDPNQYPRTDYRSQADLDGSFITFRATAYLGGSVVGRGSDYDYKGTVIPSFRFEYNNAQGHNILTLLAANHLADDPKLYGSAIGLFELSDLQSSPDPTKKFLGQAQLIRNNDLRNFPSFGTDRNRYDIAQEDKVGVLILTGKGEVLDGNDLNSMAILNAAQEPLFANIIITAR